MVAHDGTCARKAAHDCKPVTEVCDSMVHLWQPAGTIYYDSEVTVHHHPLSLTSQCTAQRLLLFWQPLKAKSVNSH